MILVLNHYPISISTWVLTLVIGIGIDNFEIKMPVVSVKDFHCTISILCILCHFVGLALGNQ